MSCTRLITHYHSDLEKSECIVYQARVVQDNNSHVKTYAGLTGDTFKARWRGHKSDFDHREKRGNTELAGYIWELKDSNIPYSISWYILGRAPSYNPVTKTCRTSVIRETLFRTLPGFSECQL